MGDTGRAFDLYTEQKLARRIERPRLAAGEILLLINAPDRGCRRLRAAAARADAELVDAKFVMREATSANELLHGVGRFRLAQQNAVHAACQDLAELPGVEGDGGAIDAVDRRLDDDGGGAMTGVGRPAIDQAAHVFGQRRHVEGAVLRSEEHTSELQSP